MTAWLAGAASLFAAVLGALAAQPPQQQSIPMQGAGAGLDMLRVPFPAARTGGNYMHNYYLPPGLSSSPWWVDWSPDGRWLAVSMQGSIWKVDPRTGQAFEITYGPAYHSSPDWSPDGKWLIYTAETDLKTLQLEILNVETGAVHALTADEHLYTDPVFSPDGTRVAYVSTAPQGYFNVYIRPIRDGRWAGPPVAVTTDHRYGRNRLYFDDYDLHIAPAWFPDGQELLLVCNRGVALGSGDVYRVPARAGGMEEARIVLSEQSLYRTRPDVSIDGKRFVYSSNSGGSDHYNNLYVQSTDGGHPYRLTFFSHDAFHPRWSPDGEWIAFLSNQGGLPQLALLETYGGAVKSLPIRELRWKRPMGVLAVQVVDDRTGKPTGARIHLKASDGKAYAPVDAYARVNGAGDRVFHTSGQFRVHLPPGVVRLDVIKGFEYQPQSLEVKIEPDLVAHLPVRMTKLTELADLGWYGGSTHVHMNYGGNLHNTLENLLMMSDAEDQDIVNEQIANKDNRILDYHHFVPGGGPHPLSRPDRLLVVGQEYRPPFYGHVFMFGMKEHLISPFLTGYEGTGVESLYPSNTDMLRKARAQGATVGYVHAFLGERDPMEAGLGGGKGYMVDAALGTIDALEWSNAGRGSFIPWYATLNNGFRISAVGGEDSISDLHQTKLVGAVRTYVYTGERGLDMQAWFEGLRAGKSFVTTGPLVFFEVEGRIPGEDVRLPEGGGEVTVWGWVRSITPLREILLVVSGEVVERIPLEGERTSADFTRRLRISASGWIHLRVEGAVEERYPLDADYAQAFTNPVWVQVGGRPVRSRAAAEYGVRWIDRLREMAERWPAWRSEREKTHVFSQFEEARKVYLERAAEADSGDAGSR